jgi:hypothetical protein
MILVVVVDPGRKLLQDGQGIRTRLDAGIVTFKDFDEGFAHTVAFWTADGRKAGHEGQRDNEFQCLSGGVGGAIVRQPLNGMRCP